MKKECPNSKQHTDGPEGYLEMRDWAEAMMRTHRQRCCPGCGLLKIWEPYINGAEVAKFPPSGCLTHRVPFPLEKP